MAPEYRKVDVWSSRSFSPTSALLRNVQFCGRAINSLEPSVATTQTIYSALQKRRIQHIATATSSFTLIATIFAFYWFCRMKKRLRHKLIMLGILGCFVRGLWYFLFAVVVIGRGPIKTHSRFCQASGFFTSLGNEISDFATLFTAIHGALQIFRPCLTAFDDGDGLHLYRHYVYAIIILVPTIMTSLAFTNQNAAFTAQGAFCGLPSVPLWYRLGLSWIPRYIIGLVVIGLAMAVYIHVELIFRSGSNATKRASSSDLTFDLSTKSSKPRREPRWMPILRSPILCAPRYPQPDNIEKVESPSVHNPWEVRIERDEDESMGKDSFPPSTGKRSRKQSACTASTSITHTTEQSSMSPALPIAAITRAQSAPINSSTSNSPKISTILTNQTHDVCLVESHDPIKRTRRQMRGQLKLIFIYPIVYVVLWLPPLGLHICSLIPSVARLSPHALAITATVCLTIMGGIDSIVFLWKEKPWKRDALGHGGMRGAIRRAGCFANDDLEGNFDHNECARPFPDCNGRLEKELIGGKLYGVHDSFSKTSTIGATSAAGTTRRLLDGDAAPASRLSMGKFSLKRPQFPKGLWSSSDKQMIAKERALERLNLELADRSLTGGRVRESMGRKWSEDEGRERRKEWWDREDSNAPMMTRLGTW